MFRYPEGRNRPFVWAHRGASASAPENTLASFRLAESQGADGVELDVHRTRDGVLAVTHDAWVSPTAWPRAVVPSPGGLRACALRPDAVRVADIDWHDLRRFVRGYDANGTPQHLPCLDEVLEALERVTAVDIEIKSAPHPFADISYPGVLEEVAAVVRRRGFADRALVSSFDHRLLRRFATVAPDIAILAIYHARVVDAPALAAAIPTVHLNMDFALTTEADILDCHAAGLFATVGGLGSAEDFATAAAWAADAVTVDDPRWAFQASGADAVP